MTVLITRAPVKLPVGTLGPFTSGAITLSPNGYQVTFTNTADWPTVGDVATVTVEMSLDGGNTWQFDAALTLGPGPWKTRGGGTTNTATWNVDEPPAATQLRATLQVLQSATLGLSVASL